MLRIGWSNIHLKINLYIKRFQIFEVFLDDNILRY